LPRRGVVLADLERLLLAVDEEGGGLAIAVDQRDTIDGRLPDGQHAWLAAVDLHYGFVGKKADHADVGGPRRGRDQENQRRYNAHHRMIVPHVKPVAIFRHSPTEGPGYFATFLDAHRIPWRLVRVDSGEPVPPSPREFSGLVFMGG